jgi:quercetin dioxygenase-like cupin family protein
MKAVLLMAAGFLALPAMAADAPAGRPGPAFNEAIPNIPGKTLTGVVVNYAPGQKSRPHHHAPSAFIMAYVLSGAVRSQVDDGPVTVYHAGESWYEKPGAHHVVSENASDTEPATLLAIFVLDSSEKTLTTPDPAK